MDALVGSLSPVFLPIELENSAIGQGLCEDRVCLSVLDYVVQHHTNSSLIVTQSRTRVPKGCFL